MVVDRRDEGLMSIYLCITLNSALIDIKCGGGGWCVEVSNAQQQDDGDDSDDDDDDNDHNGGDLNDEELPAEWRGKKREMGS